MPSCRVTNKTGQPLNICLKQVAALHFENEVKPGEEIKFKPGRVWFTLEALVDDGSKGSRYSVTKSAATIGLLAVAVGAVAATAGAALLPTAAVGGTAAAGAAAGAASKASLVSKATIVTKAALVKNAGTIAKLSSIALPKAVEKISAEVGGLTALQREVISIISSPSMPADVRHKATDLLHNLHNAYKTDKASAGEAARAAHGAQPAVDNDSQAPNRKSSGWNIFRSSPAGPATSTEPSALAEEARTLDTQLPPTSASDTMVETAPVSSGHVLRVHGVYMDRRRRFEIRLNASGKLELWDANEGALWSRHKEKERDAAEKKAREREEKDDKENKRKLGTGAVAAAGAAGTLPDADLNVSGGSTDEEGHWREYGGRGEGSITSVELNREDMETAFVSQTGPTRKGTVKDRLSALVRGNGGTTAGPVAGSAAGGTGGTGGTSDTGAGGVNTMNTPMVEAKLDGYTAGSNPVMPVAQMQQGVGNTAPQTTLAPQQTQYVQQGSAPAYTESRTAQTLPIPAQTQQHTPPSQVKAQQQEQQPQQQHVIHAPPLPPRH